MNIAAFNEKITIQKNTAAVDSIGNHTSSWADYFSCHATVSGEGSANAEQEIAGQSVDDTKANFTIRYCAALSGINNKEYRVLFKNETYDILAVDHRNFKKKSIKIFCRKARR